MTVWDGGRAGSGHGWTHGFVLLVVALDEEPVFYEIYLLFLF